MNPRWYSRFALCTCAAWLLAARVPVQRAAGADDQPVADVQLGRPFQLFGYTTRPNYDCSIHTIRVPIFKTKIFNQGVEFQLTQAVIREIEAKTPYKVVSSGNADTELTGKITIFAKNIVNVNRAERGAQGGDDADRGSSLERFPLGQNPVPALCRPGEPLPAEMLAAGIPADSGALPISPISPPAFPTTPETCAADTPDTPVGGPAIVTPIPGQMPPAPPPILLSTTGDFTPELGQSIASAQQTCVDRMAVQIINMMEKPW